MAELFCEGEQFRRSQLLAGEEDHQVSEQSLADLRDDLGGQGSPQVHPLHLGTKGAGNEADEGPQTGSLPPRRAPPTPTG